MSPPNTHSSMNTGADIAQTLGTGKNRHRRGKWAWVIAALALVLAIALWQWLASGESGATQYRTAEATRGDLTVTVTATGTLEPVNQVEVGSEISGTIEKVLVDFNDRVKQDDVLAELNTDQLKARVDQSRAALHLAQAQVKFAQATVTETDGKLHRAAEVARSGLVSVQDIDTAQAAYDRAVADLARANAQVVQAQAALDAEQVTLAKATIHSPIQGIVLSRNVEPGQTVAASFQTPVLFTLAENLTQMELHVDVDEADIGQIQIGQKAVFTVDAYPLRNFPATISEVHFASQTIEGVVTYETLLSVDNEDLLLRPGMTATAEITVQQVDDVVLVPNSALRFTPPAAVQNRPSSGSSSLLSQLFPRRPESSANQVDKKRPNPAMQQVWILKDGQPAAVPLTIGPTDGKMTEVISGTIEPGTALLVDTVSAAP